MKLWKFSRKGFALAAVFFLTVVMVFLAAGLFQLVPQELNWALRQRINTEAYYAATGGIKHSLAWLGAVERRKLGSNFSPPYEPFAVTGAQEAYFRTTLATPGAYPFKLHPQAPPVNPLSDDTYFPDNIPALQLRSDRLQFPNDWTANVTIVPDKRTFPHPDPQSQGSNRPPAYTIVALAFQDNNHNGLCDSLLGEHYSLRIECSVVAGTFARYAYFVDNWPGVGVGSDRIFLPPKNARPVFSGPVHTNGFPLLQASSQAGFWSQLDVTGSPPVVPHFDSDLSYAGAVPAPVPAYPVPVLTVNPNDGVAWYKGSYNGTDPLFRPFITSGTTVKPVTDRYERVFNNGQEALRPRDKIDLPLDSDGVALAAYGIAEGQTPTVIPPSDILFIPLNGAGDPKGGAIVSGNVRSMLLDILDPTGKDIASDTYNSPVPKNGGGVVKMVHEQNISYPVSTDTVTYYVTSSSFDAAFTGTYSDTFTQNTPPGPGDTLISTQVNQIITGTTPGSVRTVYDYGPGTVTVLTADPAGGGVVAGGAASVPTVTGSHTETEQIPTYSQETQYIVAQTGTGPHFVSTVVPSSTQTVTQYSQYSPTDAIFEPDVLSTFHASYLAKPIGPGPIPIGQIPVIMPDPTATVGYLNITISAGNSVALHHSRVDPRVFYYQDLKGHLNGAYEVNGNIGTKPAVGGGISGWNKGPKTFQTERRIWNPDGSSSALSLFNISIDGPLRHYGLTQGDMPTSGNNSLGLIAGQIDVRLANTQVDQANPAAFYFDSFGSPNNRPLYLYASMLALKSGFLQDPTYGFTKVGPMEIMGNVVQRNIGQLFDLGTNAGWYQNYNYDPFLTIGPPPGEPLDGTFQIYFCRADSI